MNLGLGCRRRVLPPVKFRRNQLEVGEAAVEVGQIVETRSVGNIGNVVFGLDQQFAGVTDAQLDHIISKAAPIVLKKWLKAETLIPAMRAASGCVIPCGSAPCQVCGSSGAISTRSPLA